MRRSDTNEGMRRRGRRSGPPTRRARGGITTRLTRKSFFVDPLAVRRAKRALGVATDAEAVRLSVERVAEMAEFWRFMKKSRGSLAPGSFERP